MSKILEKTKDKYFDTRMKDGRPLVDPANYTFKDIQNGEFSSEIKNDFFDEVWGDIIYDYFTAWLNTTSDEVGQREFLYSAAMSLGSVKSKLINYEMKGKNVAFQNKEKENDDEKEDS